MRPEEVTLVAELASGDEPRHEIEDVLPLYSTDPNGFFVGELAGRPRGTVSAVRYGADLGWVGRMALDRGDDSRDDVGGALADAALTYLNGRPVGIDAERDHVDIFGDAGFERAHANIRFRGECSTRRPEPAGSMVDLGLVPWEEIVVYDSGCFGVDRGAFLRRWLARPGVSALGVQRLGALVGWGLSRLSHGRARIGPLFADDRDAARELLVALAATSDTEIVLDVPEVNGAGLDLAMGLGLEAVSQTFRMCRGSCPAPDLDRMFGMTMC